MAIADTFSTVGDIEQAMGQRAAACVSYERSFAAYTRALVEDRTLVPESLTRGGQAGLGVWRGGARVARRKNRRPSDDASDRSADVSAP